jgi:integrase
MASVKPCTGGYRAQISIKPPGAAKAVRESRVFASARAAKEWAAGREAELRAALGLAAGVVGKTLHDVLRRYSDEVCPAHRGERWERLRIDAMLRDPALANVPLDRLADHHIAAWRDARLAKVSAGSVLRELGLLTAALEHARREWKWLARNPAGDVRKPKAPQHRERLLSGAEIRRMCRELGYTTGRKPESITQVLAVVLLFALRTGMRSGEIVGLTWGRVAEKSVRLEQTKTDRARSVPLDRRARGYIELMRGLDRVLVFPIDHRTRDTLWRRARARAGLDGFTFHDARHTAATRIGRKVGKPGGLSFPMFCKMFGWADPKFAMIYCNPSMDEVADLL